MPGPAPLVTVFGGSGFIGRYVTQRLARAGARVRVAVRRPNEALFVRPYGVVGQVEPIQANIRDEDSTRRAIAGADVVVNCVGILAEGGRQSFDAVMAEGAGRIARLSAEEGVARLVHVSAIGADPDSDSAYARAKAAGEAAVAAAFPGAVILRPSIVFGSDDGFFNRFAGMARLSPVVPVVGPDTRFQPVYVDDVAAAAAKAALTGAEPGVYELGGPEVATFRELVQRMLAIVERRRLVVALPFWVARVQAWLFNLAQRLTFGLFTNTILTSDQVRQLAHDNVVAPGARGLEALGIKPTAMDAVLESYLYSYRAHGQFDAITASERNLRRS
jgi:NADH dehydrogenase